MANLPRSVERAEELLKEVETLVRRLREGEQLLSRSLVEQSVTRAMAIVEHFDKLARQTLTLMEELVVMHQLQLLGKEMYIRRDGVAIFASQLVDKEIIELDARTLMTLKAIKEVFGDASEGWFEIVENTGK